MIRWFRNRTFPFAAALAVGCVQYVAGQVLPPGFNPAGSTTRPPQQAPPAQAPAQPAAQPPAQTPATTPGQPAAAPAQTAPAAPPPQSTSTAGLNLQNASLREVIDILARQLRISYILDPRVQGGVTINTYGETKAIDNRTLLDTILRINGYAMIPQGDIFRIVPLTDVQRMPGLIPQVNGAPTPEDDRTMLNLIFLKYATVDELAKLLTEFLGEHGKMWSYPAANLLLIQDTRRNMKRLMDLVALFDSDTFANQRVRLFDVKNSRPSDLAKELEGILKGISLNDKSSPIKLLPVDRINTLIAVAPNPGVFKDVENWISKLDITVEATAGATDNFVYRVKYGFAPTLAMAIMGLYSNNPMYAMGMMSAFMSSGMGGMGGLGGINSLGGGMMGGGMGMMGGGMGMMGMGMMGGGMGGMYGGGMGGMYGGGMGGMYGGGMGGGYPVQTAQPTIPATAAAAANVVPATGANLTGTYMGNAGMGAPMNDPRMPRIIPNPFDNTLLIQSTRQEYEGILKLLRDIDVPPRQVLIEARIYEVNLNGALQSGVSAFLQARNAAAPAGTARQLTGALQDGLTTLSAGALVGSSRQLLAALSTQELSNNARIISAPSIIATDSVPATINVGQQVPTLTSQAATGVQQGGTSLFANNISNKDTGVTLGIMARVNPSGVVTLMINQEVSAPIAPDATSAIQSPSFSRRTVNTQVTVQDGDTIAIGGIISESNGSGSTGIPGLHRLPIIGLAFGSKSYRKDRTELIIFMTPRVIYDMNSMNEATDELKSRLKKLSRYVKDE